MPYLKDLFSIYRTIAATPGAAGVVGNVHMDDHILRFLLDHPSFPDLASRLAYYFDDGRRSANRLAELLAELGFDRAAPLSLLEFASGYGCVTRHLRAALPCASINACDIHEQAVAFIEQELGVTAFRSNRVPEDLRLPRRYDVVFALSFYSHMPRETWTRWIRAHVNVLEASGVLIFTTHGRLSLPHLGSPVIPEDGFWFTQSSEQRDLDTRDYGLTAVTREFAEREIAAAVGGRIDVYREGYWWEHQDLYVVRRDSCRLS